MTDHLVGQRIWWMRTKQQSSCPRSLETLWQIRRTHKLYWNTLIFCLNIFHNTCILLFPVDYNNILIFRSSIENNSNTCCSNSKASISMRVENLETLTAVLFLGMDNGCHTSFCRWKSFFKDWFMWVNFIRWYIAKY